jgi:hypothetical protein
VPPKQARHPHPPSPSTGGGGGKPAVPHQGVLGRVGGTPRGIAPPCGGGGGRGWGPTMSARWPATGASATARRTAQSRDPGRDPQAQEEEQHLTPASTASVRRKLNRLRRPRARAHRRARSRTPRRALGHRDVAEEACPLARRAPQLLRSAPSETSSRRAAARPATSPAHDAAGRAVSSIARQSRRRWRRKPGRRPSPPGARRRGLLAGREHEDVVAARTSGTSSRGPSSATTLAESELGRSASSAARAGLRRPATDRTSRRPSPLAPRPRAGDRGPSGEPAAPRTSPRRRRQARRARCVRARARPAPERGPDPHRSGRTRAVRSFRARPARARAPRHARFATAGQAQEDPLCGAIEPASRPRADAVAGSTEDGRVDEGDAQIRRGRLRDGEGTRSWTWRRSRAGPAPPSRALEARWHRVRAAAPSPRRRRPPRSPRGERRRRRASTRHRQRASSERDINARRWLSTPPTSRQWP